MTKDEFQKKYHYYKTNSEKEVKEERDKVNAEGIEDDVAVAIKFGNLGWGLMLGSAAVFAFKLNLIPEQSEEIKENK